MTEPLTRASHLTVMTSANSPEVVRKRLPERGSLFLGAKRVLQGLFCVLCLPRFSALAIWQVVVGRQRAFSGASEAIARIPGLRGVYMRQAFYRWLLASCGRDVYFGWNSVFSMREACIGEGVFIGRFCSLGFAHLENDVMLADGVQILSGGHEHGTSAEETPMRLQEQTFRRVRVGRGTWIGAGAVIMADVGEGCVIGAGAVVSRPIPAHCVAVGVPARPIKWLVADEGTHEAS